MKLIWMVAVLAIAALAATACATDGTDTGDDTTTTGASGETTVTTGAPGENDGGTDGDAAEMMASLQSQATALFAELQGADVPEELRQAWADVEAELNVMASAAASGEMGTVDTEPLRQSLQSFGDTLESLGDEVTPELRAAWDDFSATVESFVDEFGM